MGSGSGAAAATDGFLFAVLVEVEPRRGSLEEGAEEDGTALGRDDVGAFRPEMGFREAERGSGFGSSFSFFKEGFSTFLCWILPT